MITYPLFLLLTFGEFIKFIIDLYSYTGIDSYDLNKKIDLDDFINITYSDTGFVENIISATEYRMYWYYALVDDTGYDFSLDVLNKLNWLDVEVQKPLKEAYTIALRKNKIESLYV